MAYLKHIGFPAFRCNAFYKVPFARRQTMTVHTFSLACSGFGKPSSEWVMVVSPDLLLDSVG